MSRELNTKEVLPLSAIRICHADSSGEFRRLFSEALRRTDDMQLCASCADGREAERLVSQMQPDVLVLSLTLQFLDGVELIRRVRKMARRPRILVLSYLVRDYCIEEAMRCGADYFMLKPCTLPLVLERARSLAQMDAGVVHGAALPGIPAPDALVKALIGRMGVAPELSGYRYAAEAVRITLLGEAQSVTKDLYPQIALVHHVSVGAVERAIRHAIDAAWKSPASTARSRLFPGRDRPSNGCFIRRIASACETSAADSDWQAL